MTDESPNSPAPAPLSKKKLLIGGAAAVIVAVGITVCFVLPAQYGIDPTGVGAATGLIQIADAANSPELARGAKRSGVLTLGESAAEPGKTDRWEVELGPYEAIEFKYTLEEGKAMTFKWSATAPLRYDMHAHPFQGGTALTESYGVGTAQTMQGRYVAAFTGIHGWYWQNRTMDRVKLTLEASGAITESTTFDSLGEHKRPLSGG
ncbi:MAG: hypothetical protein J7485_07065 [Sphingobium sp.]|nr:hypothetical protein [Sphingobium sp.]